MTQTRSRSRSAARLAAVQALYQQEMEGTSLPRLLHEFHEHRLGATIEDETYHGLWLDPEAHVLLTTTEPTSDRALAWWKTYAKARTCCIQLGHGPAIYSDPNYRQFVYQAIRWAAPEK